jgi:hypothetical protein
MDALPDEEGKQSGIESFIPGLLPEEHPQCDTPRDIAACPPEDDPRHVATGNDCTGQGPDQGACTDGKVSEDRVINAKRKAGHGSAR